ncbi:MAG: hypothetical protein ACF8QF_14380, partial [Phycisphaerales bacterium]
RRLNQPLRAFAVPKRAGGARSAISLASVYTAQVDIRAIKAAERTDLVVVRLQELWGRPAQDVRVSMTAPILEAWEVDGQERRIGSARVVDGALALDMTAYSPRSYAVRLAPPTSPLRVPTGASIALPYNADVLSTDADRTDGMFDERGRTIPAEMLPEQLHVGGVTFVTGPREPSALNALAAAGQTLEIPQGDWTHIALLVAGMDDVAVDFRIGERVFPVTVQSWTGFVGQWDDRIWDRPFEEIDYRTEGEVIGFRPGFIKRDEIAWFATHRHHPDLGNEAYRFSYLYKHELPIPRGATTLTLPDNPRIRILAATAVNNPNAGATPAAPLYDTLDHLGRLEVRHVYPEPPTPVFEGVEAVGAVRVERAESIEALTLASPSSTDDASGLAFRVIDPDGVWTPHWASGARDGALPRLSDGAVARHDDDTERSVWWDSEGRFLVDLGSAAPVEAIRVFSWHRSDRAPQWFSVWGSPAEAPPDAGFAHGAHEGWTLLGVVDSRDLGQGGVHVSETTTDGRPYRHLLFIAEDVGQGTFFMEVDVERAD